MTDLFHREMDEDFKKYAPLSERMRPRTIDEIVGQDEILGPGKPLRLAIENDNIPSMVLWGPPGSGKTSIANVIKLKTKSSFQLFSCTPFYQNKILRLIFLKLHFHYHIHTFSGKKNLHRSPFLQGQPTQYH